MCCMRNGNLWESHISEIRVNQIRVNQEVGVLMLGRNDRDKRWAAGSESLLNIPQKKKLWSLWSEQLLSKKYTSKWQQYYKQLIEIITTKYKEH